MKKKIKVAALYLKNHVAFSTTHYDTTLYHFFIDALKRNNDLEVTHFPVEGRFDAAILKNKFDIILLFDNRNWESPDQLTGMKDLEIPVISRTGDPQWDYSEGINVYHEKLKIDYYFNYYHSNFFYKYYPRHFKYKTIIHGLESSLYKNVKPFNKRIKNKILNSGAIAPTKLISRIIYRIRNPNPRTYNYPWYKLRTMCNSLPYVDYTLTTNHEYVGDKFPLLLQKYSSSIAASTTNPTVKYWEIPAAGCLTFMEITKKNNGDYLGFVNGESAIFINEENFKEKFEEYLSDAENPKWEKIANDGRKFAMNELNNDKGVESLVELMHELL